MSDLRQRISPEDIELILGNKERKSEYLLSHPRANLDPALRAFEVSSKKALGKALAKAQSGSIDPLIQELWDYQGSKKVLRKMFVGSEKYRRGLRARREMEKVRARMAKLGVKPGEWPYRASTVDQLAKKIARTPGLNIAQKQRLFEKESGVFMLQKLYSTARSDYVEMLVVDAQDDIVPTFTDKKEADFFIRGVRFDQKVSKSVGDAFKEAHGDGWREKALSDPAALARSLYEHQDEQRFDAARRLLVVYLDEDITAEDVQAAVARANLGGDPLDIEFDYQGQRYRTQAYVITVARLDAVVAA